MNLSSVFEKYDEKLIEIYKSTDSRVVGELADKIIDLFDDGGDLITYILATSLMIHRVSRSLCGNDTKCLSVLPYTIMIRLNEPSDIMYLVNKYPTHKIYDINAKLSKDITKALSTHINDVIDMVVKESEVIKGFKAEDSLLSLQVVLYKLLSSISDLEFKTMLTLSIGAYLFSLGGDEELDSLVSKVFNDEVVSKYFYSYGTM